MSALPVVVAVFPRPASGGICGSLYIMVIEITVYFGFKDNMARRRGGMVQSGNNATRRALPCSPAGLKQDARANRALDTRQFRQRQVAVFGVDIDNDVADHLVGLQKLRCNIEIIF